MFLFCKNWISFYTHCVTPSQEDIHRVKAFDIRQIHSYQLYLGITPEGHGIESLQSIGCVRKRSL